MKKLIFDFDNANLADFLSLLSKAFNVVIKDHSVESAMTILEDLRNRGYEFYTTPLPMPKYKHLLKLIERSELEVNPKKEGVVEREVLEVLVKFCRAVNFPFKVEKVIEQGGIRLIFAEHEELEEICILETNVDDTTGEIVANALERISNLALDVFIVQGIGKKGRPALIVKALAKPEKAFDIARLMMRELPTLGVRIIPVKRLKVERKIEEVDVKVFGKVYRIRVKCSDVLKKPEFEDLKNIARELGIPLPTVYREVLRRLGDENTNWQ